MKKALLSFAWKTFGRDGEIFLVRGSPNTLQVLQDPQPKQLLWRIKEMIKAHHNKWVHT